MLNVSPKGGKRPSLPKKQVSEAWHLIASDDNVYISAKLRISWLYPLKKGKDLPYQKKQLSEARHLIASDDNVYISAGLRICWMYPLKKGKDHLYQKNRCPRQDT